MSYPNDPSLLLVPVVISCLLAPPARAQQDPPPEEPPVDTSGGSSGSNASNYRPGVNVNVNQRTGAVEANIRLFHIPGRSAGSDAELSLSYSSTTRVQSPQNNPTPTPFHMPVGWTVNMSNRTFNGAQQLNNISIDGQQSYVENSDWLSSFEEGPSFRTGLLQYNRADANYREDTTVTVGDFTSAGVLSTLDGRRRWISGGGLLLQEMNRFGAKIEYTYRDPSDDVTENVIDTITDAWGNVIRFDWQPQNEPNNVTITLPDGRQVSVAWTEEGVSKVVDEQGKETLLQYNTPNCGVKAPLLNGMTSPSGSSTVIEYGDDGEGDCLSVCTSENCETTETWPVAASVTVCPGALDNGGNCTTGNEMVTTYSYSVGNRNNYTGFNVITPFVTPPSAPPGADPVMYTGGGLVQQFTYQTQSSTLQNGTVVRTTVSEYDHLHRLTTAWHCVPGTPSGGNDPCNGLGMAISKQEVHCYDEPSGQGVCPAPPESVESLPANYQSAKVSGSCVYAVNGVGTNMVRLSSVKHTYNGFGHATRLQKYHGTTQTGQANTCDPQTLFAPDGVLQLVSDTFREYDYPAPPATDDYFDLGTSHYGQLTGHLEFHYLDTDGTGLATHQSLGSGDDPIRVTLACYSLTGVGAVVGENTLPAVETMGLLDPTTTNKPMQPGSVPNCDAPAWVSRVPGPNGPVNIAPAKKSSFAYDRFGRLLSHTHAWLSGANQPGKQSTTNTVAYQLTAPLQGTTEASQCGTGSVVESVTHTDDEQNVTVVRHCIRNGWVLTHIDADGDRTLFEHDDVGMTTKVTEPNGDYTTADYYYSCPADSNGDPTCPNPDTCPKDSQGNSICAGCPYPPSPRAAKNSCVAHGQFQGPGNQSFANGVRHVTIKDGLGRTVATHDNLGAINGGYTAWQPRSATTYDSRGLRTLQVSRIGTSDPLIHTTQTSYNATFQPDQICDSHGVAHQTVYDNVGLARKFSLNGHQHTLHQYNDSMHPIGQSDCPLGPDTPTTTTCPATSDGTTTCCPTTASNTTTVSCSGSGNIYQTSARVDGAGVTHVMTGFNPGANSQNASIESISGTITHDATLRKYGYYVSGSAAEGQSSSLSATSTASWERDINGRPVLHKLSVTKGQGTSNATSDTYDYDGIGRQTHEYSKLKLPSPQESFYTPTSQLSQLTDYKGHTFYSYYDSMKRRVRYCYPQDDDGTGGTGGAGGSSGSQGRNYTYDSITGHLTSVTHFDNPNKCPTTCPQGTCKSQDVDGDSISYAYSRFGALLTKTYSQVTDNEELCATPLKDGRCITVLSWGYDVYQRPVCFADAVATAAGHACPTTPISLGWSPDPSTQLAWRTYWEQNNSFKRGLLKSACKGVLKDPNADPQPLYETQCTDYDYYTSGDSGGGEDCLAPTTYKQGALAGLVKSRQVCVGGSCLDGNGTMVYKQETNYDPHRRPCSQKSTNDTGNFVLHSTYTYDQYDNVVVETHESDLDTSSASNYQQAHQYDGLMRLVCSVRGDRDGNPTQCFTYEYDAFSNVTKRVVGTFDTEPQDVGSGDGLLSVCSSTTCTGTGGSGGSGGTGGGVGTPPGSGGGVGAPPGTFTLGGGGGCAVSGARSTSSALVVLLMLAWLSRRLVRRRQPKARSH